MSTDRINWIELRCPKCGGYQPTSNRRENTFVCTCPPDPIVFHGPQFGVNRAALELLVSKWEIEAADTRWNGHYRQAYADCAAQLREALKS